MRKRSSLLGATEGLFFCFVFLNLHCCNVSVDNSSLHSQATNGYPAGQGDACVSSFKGNQWQLNMREMKWPRWVCLILCALVPCETEPSHHNTLSVEKRKQAAAFLQSDPHVYDRMLYSHRTSRSLSVHVLNPTPGPMPDFPSLFNTFNAVRCFYSTNHSLGIKQQQLSRLVTCWWNQ